MMCASEDYNDRVNALPFSTFGSKTVLSVLLFIAITPWMLIGAPTSMGQILMQPPLQAAGGSRYFTQTGKTVSGAFLAAFDRYGLERTGWPLSDEMVEDGMRVQYFERVRMEYHPEMASKGNSIELTRLGAEFVAQRQTAAVKPFASSKSKAYFRETGHSLADPFLQFWRDHGAVEVFGYPISEPVWEDGLKVQWFERARMEYHPEMASKGWGVQLTRLGDLALSRLRGAPRGNLINQSLQPSDNEKTLLDLINAERAKAGAGQIAYLPELEEVARSRSSDMAARNYFAHTTPDGLNVFDMLRWRNIAFAYAGEIISKSMNVEDDQTAQVALQAFLSSSGHKAIMLDGRYKFAGVGYARTADEVSYFTVVFVQR